MIEIQGLRKSYNERPALRGVDLTVDRGELFGFLGPNGAGKTTTLRLIAGMLAPTEGRVRVAGYDPVAESLEARRRYGFVPDQPQVHGRLTGQEYLEFLASVHRLEPSAAGPRIGELLRTFGLEHRSQSLVESYSHGMRQRLVLAGALLHEPEVLLIDEPMVGLDPRGARLVMGLLRERTAAGTTVFLSTHSLAIAEELCTRIGILYEGRIIALGTSAELRDRARLDDARLEEVFLRLTEESEDGPAIGAAPA